MLMIYLTVVVAVFALASYFYGFVAERRHGNWIARNSTGRGSIPHQDDPWSLILFDCDFGASAQTSGPARTLKISGLDKAQH
ncbi:MAG: hypothetical protein JSW61_06085 [Candidatus Thorarchaeota archaeon]|nr:MAG: hypothetical protein JSW61_06085 [Candidatus Thorarchaeota archaeon]